MSDAPKKSVLDLLPSGPIYSEEPFDFHGQKVKWRLLDGARMMACRNASERREARRLVDEIGLEPKDAYQIAVSIGDDQREWYEWYVLGAALTNEQGEPISMETPDEVAYQLSQKLTPIERAKYFDDYLQFADEHDPSNLTEEQVEEIIAALGKGADSILSRLGSNSLRSLLLSMAPRLARAEALAAKMQETDTLTARVEALEREISQMPKSKDGSG